eukprot:scaffold15385_cov15-Tisochrysis_lutea.AAC.1
MSENLTPNHSPGIGSPTKGPQLHSESFRSQIQLHEPQVYHANILHIQKKGRRGQNPPNGYLYSISCDDVFLTDFKSPSTTQFGAMCDQEWRFGGERQGLHRSRLGM